MGGRAEEFTRYDSADYLGSVEDAAAYLEAAVAEAGTTPPSSPMCWG